jgi:hypothetical protein
MDTHRKPYNLQAPGAHASSHLMLLYVLHNFSPVDAKFLLRMKSLSHNNRDNPQDTQMLVSVHEKFEHIVVIFIGLLMMIIS